MNQMQQGEEERLRGARDVANRLFQVYGDEAVRDSTTSNEKIDKLSGILLQVGFAVAGVSAARIIGRFDDFPYTLIAFIFAALSIPCGALQFIFDSQFFNKYAKVSRDIASYAFLTWAETNEQNYKDMRGKVAALQELPQKSSYLPLIFQGALLALAAIFIFVELNKK